MSFPPPLSSIALLAINVAVTSIALGLVAIMFGLLLRRAALPVQHGLLCVALVLTLASPLPIWFASHHGLGVVQLPVSWTDREVQPGSDTAPVAVMNGTDAALRPRLNQAPQPDREAAPSTVGETAPTVISDASPPQLADVVASTEEETESTSLGNAPTVDLIRWAGTSLGVVWAAVASAYFMRLLCGLRVLRLLRRSLRPTTDGRLVKAARRALPTTSRKTPTRIFESHLAPTPLTLGWWRSVIVMPAGLPDLLDDEQLACVLAHEAAHVARRDTTIALLQQCASALFWWNPLLRVMNQEINRLRECICDDHVVKRFGDGFPLAEALFKVAEWSAAREVKVPLAATLLDEGDSMEQRIARLAERDSAPSASPSFRSTALLGLFAIMLAAVPLVPAVRAQVESAKKDTATVWQLRIRTVDEKGAPIANPRFSVRLEGNQQEPWKTGDDDGWFTTTLPTRRPGYCYILARADGYAPMRAFWRHRRDGPQDALPAEFTFEMTKAITVGGIVVDEEGGPIAGATVLFSAGDHQSHRSRRAHASFSNETLTTDEQGRWRCDLAPATISSASINVNHPDYAIDSGNDSLDRKIEELRDLKHVSTLKKGFAVSGRVIDTSGAPVAGATLTLCELNTSSHNGPFATTDADGRYRFERVSPRYDLPSDDDPIRFTVTILKSGFAPIQQAVPGFGKRSMEGSTKQERVVDFTLSPGATLKLRVVDSQDNPVQGAWVMLHTWHDTTALRVLQKHGVPLKTDAQGWWQWTNAPLGETIGYDIVGRGFADVRHHQISVTESNAEETIVLKRPQFIVGTVTDARTGQPIPDFVIERAFEGMAGYPFGLSWTSDQTRGKNGLYRKKVSMPPPNGSYTYRALAEGYETAVSQSTAFAEGETTVNFRLHPEADAKPSEPTALIQVSGRAVDQAGRPISGATIYLVSTNAIDKRLGKTSTAADGRYEFRDVQLPVKPPAAQLAGGGTLQVYGEAAGLGVAWHGMRHYVPQPRPAHSPKENDESSYYQGEPIVMDLSFRAARKLSGRVQDDKGQPVANARIRLSGLDYLDTAGRESAKNYREFWAMHMSAPHYRDVRTDAAGKFELSGLPIDTVGYLIVEHPSFATQTFFAAATDRRISEYRVKRGGTVTIVNGEQVHKPSWETRKIRTGPLDIRLATTGRVVISVIHDDDGTPAENVRVTAASGSFAVGNSASKKTDEQGRAELALPPGKYRLVADPPRDADYVRTYDEFEVRAGPRNHTHNLRLKAGCVVILEAVDAKDGAPIADVSFWCDDAGKMRRRVGVQSSTTYVDNPVTNAQGRLRAVVLPGKRHYGVGWSPLPGGYRNPPDLSKRLVETPAGKTVRVRFELSK